MHVLSARNRDEFLATPELVRFELARGQDGLEPTLLLKTTTLTAKFLLRLKRFRFVIFRVAKNWTAYGIQVDDDPDHPATLWSVFEYPDELAGATGLTVSSKCVVFLFNELALNVAWSEVNLDLSSHAAQMLLSGVELHPPDDNESFGGAVGSALDAARLGKLDSAKGLMMDWTTVPEWHPVYNHYITNQAQRSLVSIFEPDEGGQQEEMALWLVDNLHPTGAVRSPQIHEEAKVRELSDLLLSYEHGFFLFESKALGIWVRDSLPTRTKLSRAVAKHLEKAISQLAGGVKNVKRGLRVTDLQGNEIEIERRPKPHVIVLVPDLNLLWDSPEFGGEFFKKMCIEFGGFFHILDPAELLRIVQAAAMIASRGKATTKMMAFDSYLMDRAKLSWSQPTADFNVLLRFADDD
jgi:hypothetical protein